MYFYSADILLTLLSLKNIFMHFLLIYKLQKKSPSHWCPVLISCMLHQAYENIGETCWNIILWRARLTMVKKANQICGSFLLNIFIHLLTDQRIPGPVSCRCLNGLLETPSRWHVTIYIHFYGSSHVQHCHNFKLIEIDRWLIKVDGWLIDTSMCQFTWMCKSLGKFTTKSFLRVNLQANT